MIGEMEDWVEMDVICEVSILLLCYFHYRVVVYLKSLLVLRVVSKRC